MILYFYEQSYGIVMYCYSKFKPRYSFDIENPLYERLFNQDLRVYILQILMDSICIETEMKNVLRYLTKHIVMMAMMIIVVVDVVRRFREMAVVIDERQHYNEKTKQTLHKM